jgi:predicted outer membrane repeat protein
LTVNTLADNNPSDKLDLRRAIAAVDASSLIGLTPEQQQQVSGQLGVRDRIRFAVGQPGTITFAGFTGLHLARSVAIEGPGAYALTIDANDVATVFTVAAGVNASISGLTLAHGNQATDTLHGGGLSNAGNLMITGCILSDNSSLNGGGINNTGALTLRDSTVRGNAGVDQTSSQGGGISNSGVMTISNSTLAGNTAGRNPGSHGQGSPGYGGGIYNTGILTISNSTLAGNTAQFGGQGGGILSIGAMTLQSTLVAGNTSPAGSSPDIGATVLPDSSHNLIGDGTDLSGIADGDANGNQVGTADAPLDAKLAALNDYSGPTPTAAVLPGSPALGRGAAPTTLTADINHTDTILPVADVAALASTSGSFRLRIDQEQMQVIRIDLVGNTLTVVRGVDGTSPTSHAANAGVSAAFDQRGFGRAGDNGIDIGAYQSQPGMLLVTTGSDLGPSGRVSLRGAVDLANVLPDSSTIDFADSFRPGMVVLQRGPLSLIGTQTESVDGGGQVTVSGNHASGILVTSGQVILTGLTITQGQAAVGSAIDVAGGALTLADSTIRDNSDGTVGDNSTGALSNDLGVVTIVGCTFSGNTLSLEGYGAAITNSATMTIRDSLFTNNAALARADDGAIFSNGSLEIDNSVFTANQADGTGAVETVGVSTISGCIFRNNQAAYFGALRLSAGTATIQQTLFDGNQGIQLTGAIDNDADLQLEGCTLSHNLGGVGGALLNRTGSAVVDATLFDSNTASLQGGAIDNESTLTLTGSTLVGNSAGHGGGVYNDQVLTAINDTFTGNSADSGGGLYNDAGSTATLISLTVANNVAATGGGLFVVDGSDVLLRNSIVALNQDPNGGATDATGLLDAGSSYNLIGTGDTGGLLDGVNNNLVGVADPGLQDLGDYGGPTPTRALNPDSVAQGAGDPALLGDPLLGVDQRGVMRSGSVSIGAYQDA